MGEVERTHDRVSFTAKHVAVNRRYQQTKIQAPAAPRPEQAGDGRDESKQRMNSRPPSAMIFGEPPPAQRTRKWTRSRISSAWFAALLLGASAPGATAQALLDEQTERLLVEAVEAAAELDRYNARCRSDGSGRRSDNLNKELASKFRMTILDVQDDLFPERSYRRAKERLQSDFLEKLKQAGGCKEAKKAGMPNELRERYDKLMEEIDALP